MANILVYNPVSPTVNNRAIAYLTSVDTTLWLGVPNVLINPELPLGSIREMVVDNGTVRLLTQVERDALAAAATADQAQYDLEDIAMAKAKAIDFMELDPGDTGRVLRAIVVCVVQQFNTLRALHALPNITFTQVKTAIINEINSQP